MDTWVVFFFASNENSIIEFFSSDLTLIKKIVGPASLPEAKLSISGVDGKHEVSYKGMLQPEAYRGFTICHIFYVLTGKVISKKVTALLQEFTH